MWYECYLCVRACPAFLDHQYCGFVPLGQVRTFLAYQSVIQVNMKQKVAQLYMTKEKTLEEIQEDLRKEIVLAMTNGSVACPLVERVSNPRVGKATWSYLSSPPSVGCVCCVNGNKEKGARGGGQGMRGAVTDHHHAKEIGPWSLPRRCILSRSFCTLAVVFVRGL